MSKETENEDHLIKDAEVNITTPKLSWAERNGFPAWLMAVIWIVVALVLFQGVAMVIGVALIVIQNAGELESFSMDMLAQNLDLFFIGNSIGQVLFLGVGTWFFAKTSATGNRATSVFRLNWLNDTWKYVGLALLFVIAAQPVIIFLSWVNMQFPFSDSYLEFELQQAQILEDYLTGGHFLPIILFHVAIVPAICEEIMYRGYIQSMFNRSMAPWLAIILTGVIFGAYHIKMTQIIPLSMIGIFLAYLTHISGSLYPAIAAHFLNNAGNVVAAYLYPDLMFAEEVQDAFPSLYLLIPGFILTGILLFWIQQLSKRNGRSHVSE